MAGVRSPTTSPRKKRLKLTGGLESYLWQEAVMCDACTQAKPIEARQCDDCGKRLVAAPVISTKNPLAEIAYGKAPLGLLMVAKDMYAFYAPRRISALHLLVMSKNVRLVDFSQLLWNPAKGLAMVQAMKEVVVQAVRKVLVDPSSYSGDLTPDASDACILDHLGVGFNMPPMHASLYLEVLLLPLATHMDKNNLFKVGRFIPLDFALSVLEKAAGGEAAGDFFGTAAYAERMEEFMKHWYGIQKHGTLPRILREPTQIYAADLPEMQNPCEWAGGAGYLRPIDYRNVFLGITKRKADTFTASARQRLSALDGLYYLCVKMDKKEKIYWCVVEKILPLVQEGLMSFLAKLDEPMTDLFATPEGCKKLWKSPFELYRMAKTGVISSGGDAEEILAGGKKAVLCNLDKATGLDLWLSLRSALVLCVAVGEPRGVFEGAPWVHEGCHAKPC